MTPLIRLLLVPFVLVLAGCGFQLAGERPLPKPLRSVYIELVDPYHVTAPPLQTALLARITRSGGEVKSDPKDADTILRLSSLEEGRSVLSVGSSGQAIEYQLRARVNFELSDRQGRTLVAQETQSVSHDYSFSAQQILPKDAEEERLRSYIQDQLADLVLLRVEAGLTRGHRSPSSAAPSRPVTTPTVAPESGSDAPPAP